MTTTDDFSSGGVERRQPPTQTQTEAVPGNGADSHFSLREAVEYSMEQYFRQLGEDDITGLYELVLNEIEGPLLEAVLNHTGSNQSKASIILGLNRGTLRKKLKQHGLL